MTSLMTRTPLRVKLVAVVVLLSGRNIDMGAHRKIVCGEAIAERAA